MNSQRTVRVRFVNLVATPGALAALEAADQDVRALITRHVYGDWGELDQEDKEANEQALVNGARLLSAYKLGTGQKVWVITDAEDDDGIRGYTTVLLPSEY